MYPVSLEIEGLTLAKGPVDQNRVKGRLDLPPNFPTKRYVGKWVKKGVNCNRAKQAEYIKAGRQTYKVDGWEVYINEDTKKPHLRTLSDGQYVLMVRPKVLQETLQRINGNTSRERLRNEIKGDTIGGQSVQDYGMIPDSVLSRIPGLGREDGSNVELPDNSIYGDTTGASSAQISTKPKAKVTIKNK